MVTVGVDESGCQNQAIGIDNGVLRCRLKISNGGNTVPHDAHVHVTGGATAAIYYACIDDNHASDLWRIGGAGRYREYDTREYDTRYNRQESLDHRLFPE